MPKIKKPLAEECFILSSGEISRVYRRGIFSGGVALTPKSQPDMALSVRWAIFPNAPGLVQLTYDWKGQPKETVLNFNPVPCFEGRRVRWYFKCLVSGCGHRCDNLYLPITGSVGRFACRQCWNIDYLSHVRPKRASLSDMRRLGERIAFVENELVGLKRQHSRLRQSLGWR